MFCNKCGKQLEDTQQYCHQCGNYLKKENVPLQVVETSFNFCRDCGHELKGRYCSACGSSSVETSAKVKTSAVAMEQIKHTKATVENMVKQGLSNTLNKENVDKLKNITSVELLKLQGPSRETLIKWVKQGLIFSGILMVMSVLICVISDMCFLPTVVDGYEYATDTEQRAVKSLANFGVIAYTLLWGGKGNLTMQYGKDIQGSMIVVLPYLGLIVALLITWGSEKIRQVISKEKLTWVGAIFAATIGALATSIGSICVTKKFSLGSNDADEIYYMFGDFEYIKVSSSINLLSSFLVSFLVIFVVCMLMAKKEEKYVHLMASIKTIAFSVVGLGLAGAIAMVAKILFEQREEIGLIMEWGELSIGKLIGMSLLLVLALTVINVTMLVTGKFNILEVLINSESLVKLKLGIFNISYKGYGVKEKSGWPMTWWFVVGMLILIIIVLAVAYKLWKGRTLQVQDAIKESAVVGVGVGVVISIVTRILGLGLNIQAKADDYYFNSYFDTDRGRYSLAANMGTVGIFKTCISVAIIVFVLVMIMYFVQSKNIAMVDQVMSYINVKTVASVIGIVCIILLLTYNVVDVATSFEYFLENGLDALTSPLEGLMELFYFY